MELSKPRLETDVLIQAHLCGGVLGSGSGTAAAVLRQLADLGSPLPLCCGQLVVFGFAEVAAFSMFSWSPMAEDFDHQLLSRRQM